MALPPKYVELRIDVFHQVNQRAQVLTDLKPRELIGAILEEFGDELDFLGSDPRHYALLKVRENERLDDGQTLASLVRPGDHLVLEEVEPELPKQTHRPPQRIYLQDGTTQRSWRVPFLPAVIGRRDRDLPDNDIVVVDLSTHPSSGRVSRRHLRLWNEGGNYLVQASSANPASIVRENGEVPIPAGSGQERLLPQDIIRLDRSQITLKFIVREA